MYQYKEPRDNTTKNLMIIAQRHKGAVMKQKEI